MTRAEAYIVDAVRTPVGKRGGGLSGVHPVDLGAHALRAVVDRSGVDPSGVDDVIFGCVDAIGPQAGDIARTSWLAAGLPRRFRVRPLTAVWVRSTGRPLRCAGCDERNERRRHRWRRAKHVCYPYRLVDGRGKDIWFR